MSIIPFEDLSFSAGIFYLPCYSSPLQIPCNPNAAFPTQEPFLYTQFDMSKSAFVGQPPATIDDRLIIRGYARALDVAENMSDPTQVFHLYAVKSIDGTSDVSKNPILITCMTLAIALTFLITGTRFYLRVFRKDLSIGYDDLVIIPAAIGALSWYSLMIALAIHGGAGKPIYDITYYELNYFYQVSLVSWPQERTKTTDIQRGSVRRPQPDSLPNHRHTDRHLHHAIQPPPHRPHLSSLADNPPHIPPPSRCFPHNHNIHHSLPLRTINPQIQPPLPRHPISPT